MLMANQDDYWHIRCNSVKKDAAKRILSEINEPTGFMVDFLVYSFNDDYWNLKMKKCMTEKRMDEINDEMDYLEYQIRCLKKELTDLKVEDELLKRDILYLNKKEFEEFND